MSKITLDELFKRDEEERREKAQAEIAAEKAAWDALPQVEKDRINAEREKYWEDLEKEQQVYTADDEDAEDEEDEE